MGFLFSALSSQGGPPVCVQCRTPAAQGQGGAKWGAPQGRHRTLSFSVGLAPLQVLQSYSNIEEDCTMCPSWCLTVRARGHSYFAGFEHHIPQYSLDVPKVSVAPTAVGGRQESPSFCLGLQIPLPFSDGLRNTSLHPPWLSPRPLCQFWVSGPAEDLLLGPDTGTGESLDPGQLAPCCSIGNTHWLL